MIEFYLGSVVVGLIFVALFLLKRERESESESERERENPVTAGFQSDWKDLCLEINSVWSTYDIGFIESPSKQWYLIPMKKLYLRSCYKENLNKFEGMRSQLSPDETLKVAYIGTSGIGKSGFLQTLLVYLVHEAKNKEMVDSIRLKVFISDSSPPKDWLLRTDGRCAIYKGERVDYYLSDSADIASPELINVRIACVLATSEKSTRQFEKLPKRVLKPMPVWSYEELLQISPFSERESAIRYAIFGGSARHFLGSGGNFPVSKTFDYISKTMDWFFEEERTAGVLIEEQWNEILEYLVQCLSSANNKGRDSTRIAVEALMWHTDNCQAFFYASRFMAMLAQHILNQHESSLKEALRSLVTASGVGYSFEYLGHKEMLRGSHTFKVYGKGQGTADFGWNLPPLRLQKFRRPEDIPSLRAGSYGIPYRSNFPLVGAVVQPDTLINFTTAKLHKGANVELENLRGYLLEKDRKKHKFIWMVEDAEKFSKQEGLGDIKQYAMCYADSKN
jgi:hypothetical protein